MIRDRPLEGNFLWLADIQEQFRESLYIDLIHYSPKFLKELATRIDSRLTELGLDNQALQAHRDNSDPRK